MPDIYYPFSNYKELNANQRQHNANQEISDWDEQNNVYLKYRQEWNKAASENYLPATPLHVDIEVSDACNLRCKMCGHSLGTIQKSGFIDKKLAFQLIDQCADLGVCGLKFNWRGEATLYKHLPECVAYAKKKGILEVSINTNGFPPQNRKDSLIQCAQSGIDRLIFSVDGFSKETYEQVRIGSNYEKVLENIHRVVEWKKQHNTKRPFLRIQMVRTKLNVHEVDDFIQYWTPLMDDVRISDVMDRGQGDQMAVGDQITVGRCRCPQPFQRLTIGRDGRVSPCCADWNQEYTVGDAHNQPLKEIWMNPKFQALRAIQNKVQLDKIDMCRHCYVKESYIWKKT